MNPAIITMLERYRCTTSADYENALKEIIQEIGLLGLYRAKFFEHAAFYGGTSLRILYGLDRFSEDLDFSLLKPDAHFSLQPYLNAIKAELNALDFSVTVMTKDKNIETSIESAFIKANTKEHLLKIKVPEIISDRMHLNANLNIKLEVDTDPPPGFKIEAKTLLQPIPFSINTYTLPDLFAGKLHAILQRRWRNRVKGRDYYDFVWFIGRDIPVHLKHLEERLRQTGGFIGDNDLKYADLIALLEKQMANLDIEAAKKDIAPFLRDKAAISLWSNDFFSSLLSRLKVV